MVNKDTRHYPLFVKMALTIPLITIAFWLLSSFIASKYLSDNVLREFMRSNTRMLHTLGRQSINDIRYADYFQLRRILKDSFDPSYMKYLAVYTQDLKPLAIYPEEISGEDFISMEKLILEIANARSAPEYIKVPGSNLLHFQNIITTEDGTILGYISMSGYTNHIREIINKQLLSFIILGFFVLCIQILLIIFFTLRFTKPLNDATKLLKGAGSEEPDRLISSILSVETPRGSSREVILFLRVYKRLLKVIQEHQNYKKEVAVQAAIGRVASHIAHDMRSPLGVIGGYIRGTKEIISDKDTDSFGEAASISLEKLNIMADDLLDYSKAREIHPTPTNLKRLCGEIFTELSEPARLNNAVLNLNCPDQLHANIDPHKINRALTNIILNSIQSIHQKDSGIVDVTISSSNSDLTIQIKDNGCGIDQEHLPHIFESSFTSGKTRGTGLGLSYVKNAVEAHGGSIEVESEPKKGTAFTIELPATITKVTLYKAEIFKPPSQPPPLTEAAKEEVHTKGGHFLIIDDDPNIRSQWRFIIKKSTGHTPIELARGEELLKASIDLSSVRTAIVDYYFEQSELNGLDIVEYLKQKNIPKIYLCTGYAEDAEVLKRAKAIGVTGIIPKPIPEEINIKEMS